MTVLACQIENNEEKSENKSNKEDPKFEEEIKKITDKVNEILNTYLADRKYVKDKITNWRDAVLKECEKFFSKYKEQYSVLVNLTIYDKTKKISFNSSNNSFGSKKKLK